MAQHMEFLCFLFLVRIFWSCYLFMSVFLSLNHWPVIHVLTITLLSVILLLSCIALSLYTFSHLNNSLLSTTEPRLHTYAVLN